MNGFARGALWHGHSEGVMRRYDTDTDWWQDWGWKDPPATDPEDDEDEEEDTPLLPPDQGLTPYPSEWAFADEQAGDYEDNDPEHEPCDWLTLLCVIVVLLLCAAAADLFWRAVG